MEETLDSWSEDLTFIFCACQLCELGELASFSKSVSHLFSDSLLLQCTERQKGDSVSKVFGTCGTVVPSGVLESLPLFAFLLFYPT